MNKTQYLWDVTLTTGHIRKLPREEVADDIIEMLAEWLDEALDAGRQGKQHPLPGDFGSRYTALALEQDGALVVTVYLRQHDAAKSAHPLTTTGVARRSRQSGFLWKMLIHAGPVAEGLQEPSAPWCATHLHPALAFDPDAAQWLGDFEGCLAWAWMSL